MRNAFADELLEQSKLRDDIVLVAADIGNRLFDPFKEANPNNFYNVGVAEANAIGMAAGLSMGGFKPIVYTIATFATARCFEQIKVDVCYNGNPVIIVGVGGGFSYAGNVATHHSFEDMAILRSLPEISIVAPADSYEVRGALRAALKHDKPVYLRLGKKNEPLVHNSVPNFSIGKSISLKWGCEVCILSTGNITPEAMAAAEMLETEGISTELMSFHTIKPLDREYLEEAFNKFRLVVTVEEHGIIGGLGSAVSEWKAAEELQGEVTAKLLSLGAIDRFMHRGGNQAYARKHFGLDSESIRSRITEVYEKTYLSELRVSF